MARTRLLSLTVAVIAIASLVTFAFLWFSQRASALPPAGTDTFGVNAEVSITSRLGSETIPLTGTIVVERAPPHDEGGVEVQDLEVVDINLSGLSATGFVGIAQSPAVDSVGEVRSKSPSDDFPASSFFDVNIEAEIPGAGSFSPDPFLVFNEEPLHLEPAGNLTEWPPDGVKYQQMPDPCVKLLRTVPDPRAPNDPWLPAQICVTNISVTLGPPPTPTPTDTPCPGTCPPTATPTEPPFTFTRTPRPTNTPTRTPTPFGPEDPTFSVGPGGPSGFHPADLLRLGAGGPVTVTGNDNFANAFPIVVQPFQSIQTTFGFGTEAGEPLNPLGCINVEPDEKGSTSWYRFTPSSSGQLSVDTIDSDFDTVVAVYTGNSLGSLSVVACNDDRFDASTQLLTSRVDTQFNAGTTYYIQAGGWNAETGTLHLYVGPIGGSGAGASDIQVAVTCPELGLSACGSSGSQDDVDALSFGDDTIASEDPIAFSVATGSQGQPGTGIAGQAGCDPPQPQADEFASNRNGTNTLLLDGDGQGGGCPGAFGLGLTELPNSDNLDALDGHRSDYVDEDNDGQLDRAVYFSLAPGSPSLTAGRGPADILWSVGLGSPGMYASAAQLGLLAADDIDGLCIVDRGGQQARYEPEIDDILFSLKVGSPSLASLPAGPGDVLAPGPSPYYQAAELGMRSTDDLDAMKCFQTSGAQRVKVAVGETQVPPVGFWFCDPMFANDPCVTKISIGDTVEWNWVGTAPHSVTECGPSCPPGQSYTPVFDSGIQTQGEDFEHTFTDAGTFQYFCEVHPSQRGTIIVNDPDVQPTPVPTATPPSGVPGDANKDGQIDAVDSALILQHTAGLFPSINSRADSNGDGSINAVDASLILQYVAGLLPDWPP